MLQITAGLAHHQVLQRNAADQDLHRVAGAVDRVSGGEETEQEGSEQEREAAAGSDRPFHQRDLRRARMGGPPVGHRTGLEVPKILENWKMPRYLLAHALARSPPPARAVLRDDRRAADEPGLAPARGRMLGRVPR